MGGRGEEVDMSFFRRREGRVSVARRYQLYARREYL